MRVDSKTIGQNQCVACRRYENPNLMIGLQVDGLPQGWSVFKTRQKVLYVFLHLNCIDSGMDRVKELLTSVSYEA